MVIMEFGQNQDTTSLELHTLSCVKPWKTEEHTEMRYMKQAPPSPFQPLIFVKRLNWTFFNYLLSQVALQLLLRCYSNPGVNPGAQECVVRALKTPSIEIVLLQVKEEDEEGCQGLKALTKSQSVNNDNVILQTAHLQQLSSKDLK